MLGGFDFVGVLFADEDTLVDAFRTGAGVGWDEHDAHLSTRHANASSGPHYRGSLVQSWIRALDGVEARLRAGIAFAGFDYHEASIMAARKAAAEAGVADRVSFEVASAASFPGTYDLVCHFDCIHDMGDPVGAARHVNEVLTDDGTWLLVEPMAADTPEENHNPVGRVFFAGSTLLCTPSALAQNRPHALGKQVGEVRWRHLLGQTGFSHVRRAAGTPFNLVLEVRR